MSAVYVYRVLLERLSVLPPCSLAVITAEYHSTVGQVLPPFAGQWAIGALQFEWELRAAGSVKWV